MRKFLALLLAVVVVFPMIVAALSLIAISTWVLDRSFYESVLGDTRLYEVLLSRDPPNYFNRQVTWQISSDVPIEALGRALREVVTPEYARDQALRIVADLFDALEGRRDTLDLTLDLSPIKDALRGEGGQRFAQTLAAELPRCEAGENPVTRNDQSLVIIACRPNTMSVNEAARQITQALPDFINQIPNQIDLTRRPIDFRVELRGVPTSISAQSGLNLAIVIVALLAGSIWLVAAFVGGEDRRARLLWLGWMLIVPAALIFLIGVGISTDFSLGWMRYGLNQARFEGVEYSAEFRDALINVTRSAQNTVANGFFAAGGVAGAFALALIAWGSASRPIDVTLAPPPPPIEPQPPVPSEPSA